MPQARRPRESGPGVGICLSVMVIHVNNAPLGHPLTVGDTRGRYHQECGSRATLFFLSFWVHPRSTWFSREGSGNKGRRIALGVCDDH